MSDKKYTKTERAIAQKILAELEQQYKIVRANDAGELFYKLRDYITKIYLNDKEK